MQLKSGDAKPEELAYFVDFASQTAARIKPTVQSAFLPPFAKNGKDGHPL
jgi:hypothetical protein